MKTHFGRNLSALPFKHVVNIEGGIKLMCHMMDSVSKYILIRKKSLYQNQNEGF